MESQARQRREKSNTVHQGIACGHATLAAISAADRADTRNLLDVYQLDLSDSEPYSDSEPELHRSQGPESLGSSSSGSPQTHDDESECIVCFDNQANACFAPCGHTNV